VGVQALPQHGSVVSVREQILDAAKARPGCGVEALEKVYFVE
jgi:hypothetical protein